LSHNQTVRCYEICNLRSEIVNKHSTIRVSRNVNLFGVDAIVTVDLVHKFSNEINIVIACESIASSASVQSVATFVAVRPGVLGACGGDTCVTNVP